MTTNALLAEVAALVGDPGRAGMLHALMDGRALTASELAQVASITPQTASGHLSRMTAIGLLSVEKQGRHRYHRLATPAVAHMLESMMQVASALEPSRQRFATGPRDAALRTARTCYDHLAGRLGVALADAMVAQGYAEFTGDAGIITKTGVTFLRPDRNRCWQHARSTRQAHALPAVSRLERAAAASCRRRRGRTLRAEPRERMGPPHGRDPRRAHYATGPSSSFVSDSSLESTSRRRCHRGQGPLAATHVRRSSTRRSPHCSWCCAACRAGSRSHPWCPSD